MSVPARPLSILMLIQKYPPEFGGAEVQASRLAARLRRRGHEVTVWTIAWRPTPTTWVDPEGTPVRSFAGSAPPRFRTIAFALEAAARMVIERRRFDVAHFHLYSSHAIVGAPVAKALGKPALVKFGTFGRYGDLAVQQGTWRGWLRIEYLKRVADCVIYLNKEMHAELERLRFSERQLAFMPNGMDVEAFIPPDEAERAEARRRLELPERPLVSFTGMFREQKQLPTLLEAFDQVRAMVPEALLVLAGEGPLEDELKDKVATLRLERHVHFTGPLPREGVLSLLKASDLFVLPSASEGLSNALMEAMATGLPSVVSDIPGNQDLVDHEVEGLRVAVGDVAGLASAISQLISDEPKRRRMGAAARVRVAGEYSIQAAAERYERLYHRLLSEDPRPAFENS